MSLDERAFYSESPATKPVTLNCPYCHTSDSYEVRWIVRKKKDRIPPGADERDRANCQKAQGYMVLAEDKVGSIKLRCRIRIGMSVIKTMAFL